MPIYEYRCKGCGKEFELIQKFSDKPVKECIHCGGAVEKLISISSFQLKGDGWYKDGYASCKPAKETSKGSTESAPKPSCAGCPSAGGETP